MDSKTYASNLSEAKVVADLAQKSYHIFTQTSGKAPFDLVVFKDKLSRVQIKSCYKSNKNSKYRVMLKTVHTSMKQNVTAKFDATKCDILAIYFIDVDKVCYLDPAPFHNTTEVTLSVDDSRFLSL